MELKPINILYIEDNPGDVVIMEEMLSGEQGAGFQLESADLLSTGLERLEKGGIDVVLLDLSLPDSHGLETFERMRNRTSGVPIIVMTGTDDKTLAVKAVQEGAQDYLVKGRVDAPVLVRAMRYAIEREKLVVELRKALEQIKTLRGLIPICASCKNIRDDQGFWHQVEAYIGAHSEAEFSHGLCPACAKRLYPEVFDAHAKKGGVEPDRT
jgi:DNA-binding NtrC family response regulator